jgi:hypothetical protein
MTMRSFIGLPPVAVLSEQEAPARPVLIEWSDEIGRKVPQWTELRLSQTRGLTVVVPQQPPPNSVAQVREGKSSYPVEIVSTKPTEGGFELHLDYLHEGRRREERVPTTGQAVLERAGLTPVEVEVVNVSCGGIQLFSVKAVSEGCTARVCGAETECLCLIRYCAAIPGGYRIGLQFYGENRKGKYYGNQQLC